MAVRVGFGLLVYVRASDFEEVAEINPGEDGGVGGGEEREGSWRLTEVSGGEGNSEPSISAEFSNPQGATRPNFRQTLVLQ